MFPNSNTVVRGIKMLVWKPIGPIWGKNRTGNWRRQTIFRKMFLTLVRFFGIREGYIKNIHIYTYTYTYTYMYTHTHTVKGWGVLRVSLEGLRFYLCFLKKLSVCVRVCVFERGREREREGERGRYL